MSTEHTQPAQTGTQEDSQSPTQLTLFEQRVTDAAWAKVQGPISQKSWGTPEFQKAFAKAIIEEYRASETPPPPPIHHSLTFLRNEATLREWLARNFRVSTTLTMGSPDRYGNYAISLLTYTVVGGMEYGQSPYYGPAQTVVFSVPPLLTQP